jgi:hypothetical protein
MICIADLGDLLLTLARAATAIGTMASMRTISPESRLAGSGIGDDGVPARHR